ASSSQLFELARPGLGRSKVFGRFRVLRVGASKGIDVTADRINRVRLQHTLPGYHSFTGNPVPDGGEVVDKVRAVDPVIVTEVRAHEPAAVRPMTRRAKFAKSFVAISEHGCVGGRLQRGH